MTSRTWSEIVEGRAKTFDLAAKLGASVNSDSAACAWHAHALREMARILDRDARARARVLAGFRLLGLKIEVSRDG